MQIGDVVVHKSAPNVALVVVRMSIGGDDVDVSYLNPVTGLFAERSFNSYEIETPAEAIHREAAVFEVLNQERQRIADAEKPQAAPTLTVMPGPIN